ncbi:type I polyketide synthase [Amycolatopsis sp. VS8301801F10]|uniref:type I polyketide synthase n=1 Tax=Amycolatopsis sp. VS8301801F10 TaxID=2652442 RepID=UPI0038FC807E
MANEDKLRDYLKLVTANLRQARRQLADVEQRAQEPIAIVGMGCRFPGGAHSPDALWQLLAEGADAIGEFPQDRGWDLESLYDADPDRPGTSYARHGGFVYDAAGFDAEFFGISPREALMMDPQQRLFLEVAWEAVERAGIPADSLRGTTTGVFAGAYNQGYGANPAAEAGGSEGHLVTGVSTSVLSGRVAFTMGLEGPAVTLDTACSSSLVALHLAAQALRSGECSLALVGGVTVISGPGVFVGFSRQRGMSTDGRCRSFSADAEGSGWAEGAGVLAVERLSDARRHGHPVLAVIRGSAINQDGASNGLTAPHGPSQQRVIRAALANARLSGSDVDVVEAHGSATTLGDPIEAEALLATYGRERPEGRPLWLGSVKSNIGHSQAAAGVAGVIKMVLALRNGQLPRTLHVGEPTPHVDWSAGEVRLLAEPVPWEPGERVRRAGVSSFGMSGTNAHVILEEAPAGHETAESAEVSDVDAADDVDAVENELPVAVERVAVVAGEATAWPVSGRSADGLAAQRDRLAAWVEGRPELDPVDVGWSLAVTRSVFEHRSVTVGGDLASLRSGVPVQGVARSGVRPVFVFGGQGAQWAGMGRALLDESPVFAARFAECARALESCVDWSPREVLLDAAELASAEVVQPLLWAVMVSLAAVWEAAGVEPEAVVGHSQGEVAAATVAGMLSVEDAARVVVARSRGLSGLSVEGSMVSVVAPVGSVAELVERWGDRLSVAAVNGPAATVVSGNPEALAEFERELASRKMLRWRVPETDFVAHSAAVEPLEGVLADELGGIEPQAGRVPMMSTVTGGWVSGEELDAGYWYRNLRQTVRFEEAARALLADGFDSFVEVSPHPVLTASITETAEDAVVSGVVAVGTVERDHAGAERLLTAFAEGFVHGLPVDWAEILPVGTPVELPTYAFQHQHYWLNNELPAVRRSGAETPGEDWRYRVSWVPVAEPAPVRLAGTWLVVTAAGQSGHPLARECRDALADAGAKTRTLELPDGAGDRGEIAALVADDELSGVLSLLSLDETHGLTQTVALVQALGDRRLEAPLWTVTSGAVAAVPGEAPKNPAQAGLWGLGRVAALEHPDRWGGLVDVPETLAGRAAKRLTALLVPGGEDQVAIRETGVLGRRLLRAATPRGEETPWTPRETALITGEADKIGGHVARLLADRGASRVVLAGRRGPDAGETAAFAAELAAAGTAVDIVACDTGARPEVAAVVAGLGSTLSSVLHTEELIDDRPIEDADPAELDAVLAVKAGAAAWLHELTADLDLDAFVLTSSVAAVWGGGRQPGFSAANARLDALAEARVAAGLPAASVAWGPWGADAMNSAADQAQLERRGLSPLAPDRAIGMLARIMDAREAAVTVADVDWAKFAPPFTLRRPSPLLELLPEVRTALTAGETAADQQASGSLKQQLAELSAAEQERLLVSLVRTEAAAVLDYPSPSSVPASRAFSELGFDSLTAVELRNRLGAATGLKLPATLLFDYPNPTTLAGFLGTELLGAAEPAPVATATTGATAAPDDDPVVIVGMSCRFPGGVRSPEELWELLASGTDAIGAFPQDRGWELDRLYDPDPEHAGTSYARQGGFVYDAAEFDAGFFGISPREALAMDPQQRMLLEVSWEALERAGVPVSSLRGSKTGVWAGASFTGYGLVGARAEEGIEGHLLTGTTTSVLSGRLSYTFGLEGPAVTVDTACSSALVAVDLASQALRLGECSLALAGGVFVSATPDLFVWVSRQRGLSPDGRSKSFSAEADGMGIAEGAGMVVLERLSEARRHGHPVLAVVRGSAVNQDGASNGLTAPNGPSQQRVIRAALANAGLSAQDVDVVEAHGSGTSLGDPIEAQAVIATYGQDRPRDRPVWLGSVKSNIGHPQAAAGIGGLLKMVLALGHKQLPKTLHADEPTPHVDWSAGAVELLTAQREWEAEGRPRRGGVSSFGVSGTNAHIILEEAPEPEAAADPESPADPESAADPESPADPESAAGPHAWTISGRTAESVRAQAARLAEHLAARPGLDPADVAWSLASTRTLFEYRAVITGADFAELASGLAAVAAGESAPGVVVGASAAAEESEPVFVFPGQGAQWAGMGRELLASSPVFAARMAECERALRPHVDWSLTELLRNEEDLDRAEVGQPALWAVMVSLAAVWAAAGVAPSAVLGHSQGEIAAATVAGILSLDDAAKVVAVRGKALSGLGAEGGMLSVVMPAEAVRELLERWEDRLAVAAINGPAATVVSGETEALAEFERELASRRVLRWRVPVSDFVAHSAGIAGLEDELLEGLADIRPRAGEFPLFSTVECRWMDGEELDAAYWFANVRRTVRFDEAVRELAAAGHRAFVEVSPQPVLTTGIAETIEDLAVPGAPVITGTVEREQSGVARLLVSLAQMHVGGTAVDWPAVLPAGQRVDLPTYAFQRQRYWLAGSSLSGPAPVSGGGAVSAADAQFWAAVEEGDLGRLGGALAADAQRSFHEVLPALAAWRRREQDRDVTGNWRYRVTWRPVADPAPAPLTGTWLAVVPTGHGDDSLVRACVGALAARGADVAELEVDAGTATREELAAAVAGPLTGVVSLLALDETPLAGASVVPGGLAGTTTLIQALADAEVAAPLWLVTAGAVATGPGDVLTRPVQTQTRGLGRVLLLEQPDRWGGMIDLPAVLDERTANRLCAVLAGCGEDEVALRPAGILGRRIVRAPQPAEREWRPRGTTLITGGTGAVGGRVARWLAEHGAEKVVLTSRSGASAEGAAALAATLADAGTAVEITGCDAASRADLSGVLDRIGADGPALTAVMHTAGVLDDGVLDRMTTDRLARALAAKAGGAAHLDELTAELPLDAFVLFSSAAATFGGAGQANYAAANAYLDGLAENRRSRGLPALSVAWGPWSGGGVSQASEAARARLRRNHWEVLIDPDLGVKALAGAMAGPDTVLTVMDLDWPALAAAPGQAAILDLPFVRDLPDAQRLKAGLEADGGAQRDAGELAQDLAGRSRAEQDRLLTDLIRAEAAAVLGYAGPQDVEPTRAFSELGFDSLTSVELRNRISAAAGVPLPATLMFDYPTPAVLAEHLRTTLLGARPASPAEPLSAAAADDDPIALVAMSCRFPGDVNSPDELWDLLSAGGDGISGFPADRGWDADALFDPDPANPGTTYARQGGFLHQATAFDPGFFGISPREALAMDPQQRLLLELSWEALESAGLDPVALRGSRTGVFIGGYSSNYAMVSMQLAAQNGAEAVEGHLISGNATSIISGRISYTLGLEGPALTVDTACSSSLVALHTARQALRTGECSLALVGGVSVMATPWEMVGFARQRGIAADGRSKAFSEAADGMGMGEGAGMLVLERLSDARRNGHPVLAVVAGSAINQDGASNGLTAPNGPSQQRVIRAALANAGLSASEVDVVEAHGTGTTLGDPIEAQALLATYGQERAGRDPLWLGSVKSNIGHTQAAAGVAGVIKMVLALRNKELPRTLHVETPSSHVDWAAGQVELLTENVAWESGGRVRRAGVSAFGISGTNAHVIVEEAPEEDPAEAAATEEPTVWVVSGRSADGLLAQAGRLREWVVGRGLDPVDVGWSLATTRSVFDHRAVVFGDDLLSGLDSLVAGESVGSVVSGVADPGVRVGLVFAGQGSQWAGMGRGLYEANPVFAEVFDRVSGLLELELGVSVRDVVLDPETPGSDQTLYAQTGLFAFEVALFEVLRAAGVGADAVVGHSVGEVAAAHAAGVLSLPDACRLVAARARLMQALPVGGAMAAVNAPEAEVLESLVDGVSIAAVNGPESVVVSGEAEAVDRLVALWKERGRRVRRLRVSHAFHSAAMDPVLAELREVADGLTYERPELLWAGALTGELVSDCEAGYWPAQTRRPVRYGAAVDALVAQGVSVFLEVGPDGSLSALGPAGAVFVPLQRKDGTGLIAGLARAFVQGVSVDWRTLIPQGNRVQLPTYAFQHKRYWPQGVQTRPGVAPGSAADAEFWAAVESGDLTGLADTLSLEDSAQLGEVLPALVSWRKREQDRTATADWRYRVSWAPIPEPAAHALSGRWIVVRTPDQAEHELPRVLAEHGAEVSVLEAAESTDVAAMTARIEDLVGDGAVSGLVSLLALDETPVPGFPNLAHGVAGTQTLIQAMIALHLPAPLWTLTRGAVSALPGEPAGNPVQAQAWGVARVAVLEHPDHGGGMIDVPAEFDDPAARRLCALLAGSDGEDQLAIRENGIFGRRLGRAGAPQGAAGRFAPSGTALITGGTGAIGGHVARWLGERGVERLVVTSRSGAGAAGAAALAAELAGEGTAVEVFACDAAVESELAGVLARIGHDGPPLKAVLHAAGVAQATPLDEISLAELATVLAAKADGAAALDRLTAGMELDAFVLFSSIAATWGSGMQASYAAANCYLDALAENRLARGLAATSVAWGPWGGGGMTDAEDAALLSRRGLGMLDPGHAVDALAQVLDSGESLTVVADVDWGRFAPPFTLRRPSRLIESLPDVVEALENRDGEPGPAAGNELAGKLSGLSQAEQQRLLVDLVRAEAATVLGHEKEVVEADRSFSDLGADSLTAVELRDRLGSSTGMSLPSTLLFDYPTPAALAGHLRTSLVAEASAVAPVLAELDKLQGLLDGLAAADESALITNRLEVVLAKWKEAKDDHAGDGVEEKLESSSDDEVFDFIGKELGIY